MKSIIFATLLLLTFKSQQDQNIMVNSIDELNTILKEDKQAELKCMSDVLNLADLPEFTAFKAEMLEVLKKVKTELVDVKELDMFYFITDIIRLVLFKKNNQIFIHMEKKDEATAKWNIIMRFVVKLSTSGYCIYSIPNSCKFEYTETIEPVKKCTGFKKDGEDISKTLLAITAKITNLDNGQVTFGSVNGSGVVSTSPTGTKTTQEGNKIIVALDEVKTGIAKCLKKYEEITTFQVKCLHDGIEMSEDEIKAELDRLVKVIESKYPELNCDVVKNSDGKQNIKCEKKSIKEQTVGVSNA